MALKEDLDTVATDLETALAVVKQAVTDLGAVAPTPAETAVTAVVAALEAAGYTVTAPSAPEVETPVEEVSTGEETDATTDAPTA